MIYFITPAFRRYELSEIVFECRRRMIERLAEQGIAAQSVVIADDKNLEIAEKFGFATVERDNQYLGMKFNDGYEYAAEHGGTYVVPVGSDSFLDPGFLIGNLPEPQTMVCSPNYAIVDRYGIRRAQFRIVEPYGVTYCFNLKDLEKCNFRPCDEYIPRGCDTSTNATLKIPTKIISEVHSLECVAFQSASPQLTDFDVISQAWDAKISFKPFGNLSRIYGADLVSKVQTFYSHAPMLRLSRKTYRKHVDIRKHTA